MVVKGKRNNTQMKLFCMTFVGMGTLEKVYPNWDIFVTEFGRCFC